MAKIGRPTKPYHPSDGTDPIPGLTRQKDGRWRIISTGERFSEADEHRAIDRFFASTGGGRQHRTTAIEIKVSDVVANVPDRLSELSDLQADRLSRLFDAAPDIEDDADADTLADVPLRLNVPDVILWPWLRKMLCDQPAYVAKMTGLPVVAGLSHLPMPKESIRLRAVLDAYKEKNPSTSRTKGQVVNTFEAMMTFTGAKTLADLTQEKLQSYRLHIETTVNEGSTRAYYYSCTKRVLAFGPRAGLDAEQIAAALARCKVLWTDDAGGEAKPNPISREDFHTLLTAAGDGPWRLWLLLGLNLCMTIEELCGLKWDWFNLDAGTFSCIRQKTRRKKIPRAAVLWGETAAELAKVRRRGPYVFTSKHGTRYNRNSKVNDFREFADDAKLPTVKNSQLRDAAYTSASHGTTDERIARVLAGHKADGLQDRYVLRNPEIARPACEAVYKAYGPFPASPNPKTTQR